MSDKKEKELTQEEISEVRKLAQQAIKKKTTKEGITKYQYQIVIGCFVLLCGVALFSIFFSDTRKLSAISVIDDDEIETHNQQEHTFKIGKNEFFQDWKLSDAKKIISNQLSNKPTMQRCQSVEDTSIIPERYNFREKHAECVKPIQNQGNCSSSYTVAAVSAAEDRFCLMSKGKINVKLSAQNALSCDSARNYGCKGGAVSTVYDYARREGLVDETCLPFGADAEIICPTNINTCQKYFVQEHCLTGGEEGIKREIYKNGPVVGVIPVYRDFLVYTEGIYQVIDGTSKFQSGHAIKIVGWEKEEETGLDYWIIENWWGESWGLKGLGHIYVGQKDLYLDEFGVAPLPKVDKEKSDDDLSGEAGKEELGNKKQDQADIKDSTLDTDNID